MRKEKNDIKEDVKQRREREIKKKKKENDKICNRRGRKM